MGGKEIMKSSVSKHLAVTLAAGMLAGCGSSSAAASTAASEAPAETTTAAAPADLDTSSYTIRIYSNSNSTERTTWLIDKAKEAGFNISIDDNSVISGDVAAVEAANNNKDGDLIFGLNETRWGQITRGEYENLSLVDWTPSWADTVGDYAYPGKAYGLVVQNILMLCRTDDLGTNGEVPHYAHWADMVNDKYSWYRQNKVGGTTNSNINAAMLYSFVDPESPAGGISVDGWKALWKFCADGTFSGDDDYKYGFTPLNKGDVQITEFYSSALYGQIDAAAETSDNPITPDNWALVDIDDGTYYIAEYVGILDKADRTDEQTEIVKAFADWFGSAEVQAEWAENFDTFPCNSEAASMVYGEDIPEIYTLPNFALNKVEGTEMTYAEYVGAHVSEWTNIMTNLGFYWKDASEAAAEPDWDNLDWATLTQKAAE